MHQSQAYFVCREVEKGHIVRLVGQKDAEENVVLRFESS